MYLRNFFYPEHQEAFASVEIFDQVDWVDPATAEMQWGDRLQSHLPIKMIRSQALLFVFPNFPVLQQVLEGMFG